MGSDHVQLVVEEGQEIIFCERKSYWKPRVDLDIVVVLHRHQCCYEVAIYNPDVGKEAPRIYIDSCKVRSKICENDLEKRVRFRTEQLNRLKHHLDSNLLEEEALQFLLLNFILARLSVRSVGAGVEPVEVVIAPHGAADTVDPTTGQLDIVCPVMPADVVPVMATFHKKVSSFEMMSLLHSIQSEAKEAMLSTNKAVLSTASVDGFRMTLAQRLRWMNCSTAQLRWIRAIHRVIIQLFVTKVRDRLHELDLQQRAARRARYLKRCLEKRPKILRKDRASLDKPASRSHDWRLPPICPSPAENCSRRPQSCSGERSTGRVMAIERRVCSLDSYQPAVDRGEENARCGVWLPSISPSCAPTRSPRGKGRKQVPSILESFSAQGIRGPRPLSAKPAYVLSDVIAKSIRCDARL